MSTIDITVDAGEYRDMAELRGLNAAQFTEAARRAVSTTVRQLQRLGLSLLAKKVGDRFIAARRIRSGDTGSNGRVWFGLEPVSTSSMQSPPAYSFATPSGARFARRNRIAAPFVGKPRGFKDRRGNTDIILKLFRAIHTEGTESADVVSERADELLRKNLAREIDQVIRRSTYGKAA